MKQIKKKKTQAFPSLYPSPILNNSFMFCFAFEKTVEEPLGMMNEFIMCRMWAHRYSVRNMSRVSDVHS